MDNKKKEKKRKKKEDWGVGSHMQIIIVINTHRA